ncbi:NUDIX hydrolase [Paenibacillus hodogayensis]|uniref:NUDIX hydrolase n=1 Tax=Paenibacillus hodogayensis TaxID=279208 RepID=A0ABV5VZ71_9BACL
MSTIQFCSSCGTKLEIRKIDDHDRLACPACPFVHWGSYSIGVGALLKKDGKVLLVRRAQEPGKGYWTNPGGYIEQHEQIHRTIEREVSEEAGIVSKAVGILALRDQPRDIHNVYVAFEMEYVSGEPTPDNYEVDAAGFFDQEEMEGMNVAPFTRWLVDIAFNGQGEGLQQVESDVPSLKQAGLFKVSTGS